jgi:IMP dehydrogenase
MKEKTMMAAPVTDTSDLRVADFMTIDPIVVSVDAPIEEAEELMRRNRVTGLPVVDLGGRLVGVVSQTDILFLDVPAVRALIRRREHGVRVGEVMSAPALTIDANAPLRDAAIRMHTEQIHRLVATDDHGRPVGVIAAMDFVTLVAEG